MTAPTVSLTELGKLPLPGLQHDPLANMKLLDFSSTEYGWAFSDGVVIVGTYWTAGIREIAHHNLAIACRAAERWWCDYADALWFMYMRWHAYEHKTGTQRECHTAYLYAHATTRRWAKFAALLERGAEIVP